MKTPHEYAIELFTKMYDAPDDKGWVSQNKSRSINQAIIAIDEMIVQNGEIYLLAINEATKDYYFKKNGYLFKVKNELIKMQ